MNRTFLQCAVALFLSVSLEVFANPVEGVDELLQKASQAVQESNYKGRYTYDSGSGMETLEILHVVKDGVELERVSHLNGVQRAFSRYGRAVDCVSTGNFLLRGGLVSSNHKQVSLSNYYHFYIRGDERIAGRDASVIQVVPKDNFRYGFTLALDKQSYLPLLVITMKDKRNAVERFQAVQLQLDDGLTDDGGLQDDQVHIIDGAQTPCDSPMAVDLTWKPTWVPEGFVMSHSENAETVGDSLTYTDGMSSFTLFMKPAPSAESLKRGAAQKGATTAYLDIAKLSGKLFQVVLVGEVPANTAQRVVDSVKFRPSVP